MIEILKAAFPGAPIAEEDGGTVLGPVRVYPHEEGWVVATPEAHGHFESADEAAQFAIELLRGQVRSTQLFRGKALASTWMEVRDGDAYEVQHVAMFLSPFDREEWELEPGEGWRQVRTTHLYNPLTGQFEQSSFDRIPESGELQVPDTTTWLVTGLGDPPAGTKWMVGPYAKLVYLCPTKWRRRMDDHEGSFVDHFSPDQRLLLRSIAYFREAEEPRPLIQTAVFAQSVEFECREDDADWHSYRWTMLFSDGEQDMMGILELFYPAGESALASRTRSLLDSTVGRSMMAPPDWNMTPPDD